MTTNYRVNLGFTGYSDSSLNDFTINLLAKLIINLNFPALPIEIATLQSLQNTYQTALAAAANGGRQLTAAKNAAREALLAALRTTAAYVQTVASQDLAMLLTSGFLANSTDRTSVPLDTPDIIQIDNGMTSQFIVRVKTLKNARAYEVQVKNGTGGWVPAGVSVQGRGIAVNNLTPGSTYSVQVRGIGGSEGYSDWSNPVSKMAT